MGGCGSDMLERLGPQFGKFVAIEKGKDFLSVKINELKNTVAQKSTQIKNETFNKIDEQERTLLNKVSQTAKDINKQSPGTLEKAALLQRKSPEELLGAGTIKQKFSDLKFEIQNKFEQQKQYVIQEINTQGQNQRQFLESQRPKIPIYDSLPEKQQKMVFEEGMKRYGNLVASQQDEIKKQIESSLNLNKYTDNLRSIQNGINLDSLTKSSSEILDSAKNGFNVSSAICC